MLDVGGNENAFTSVDYTGYYQRVPREQLATMMEFEADRMTGLVLKDENVLPERDVVLEEYHMRVANKPDARLERADHGRALSQSSLRPPGDRLAPEIEKLTARMRWPSTGDSTRPTTRSW